MGRLVLGKPGPPLLRVCHSTGDRELLSVSGWGLSSFSRAAFVGSEASGAVSCLLRWSEPDLFFSSRGLWLWTPGQRDSPRCCCRGLAWELTGVTSGCDVLA